MNRTAVAMLLLSLMTTGCGEDPDFATDTETIRLIHPGASPGRKLAYAIPDSVEFHLNAHVSIVIQIAAGDFQPPSPGPGAIRFPVKLRGSVLTVGKPGPAPAAMRAEIEAVTPITGSFRLDERGWVRDLDLPVPESATKRARYLLGALRDRIRWLCVPLPDEEIGVGARWKVVRPSADTTTIATCRLATLSGRSGSVEVEFETRGKGVGDHRAERIAEEASGTGVLEFSLTRPFAKGEIVASGNAEYNVEEEDRHQVVKVETTVRTRLESASN